MGANYVWVGSVGEVLGEPQRMSSKQLEQGNSRVGGGENNYLEVIVLLV